MPALSSWTNVSAFLIQKGEDDNRYSPYQSCKAYIAKLIEAGCIDSARLLLLF